MHPVRVEKQKLTFRTSNDGVPTSDTLLLENLTEGPLTYKLKTTDTRHYAIRPNQRVIEARGCIDITAIYNGRARKPGNSKDHFLLEVASVPDSPEFEASRFWDARKKALRRGSKHASHIAAAAVGIYSITLDVRFCDDSDVSELTSRTPGSTIAFDSGSSWTPVIQAARHSEETRVRHTHLPSCVPSTRPPSVKKPSKSSHGKVVNEASHGKSSHKKIVAKKVVTQEIVAQKVFVVVIFVIFVVVIFVVVVVVVFISSHGKSSPHKSSLKKSQHDDTSHGFPDEREPSSGQPALPPCERPHRDKSSQHSKDRMTSQAFMTAQSPGALFLEEVDPKKIEESAKRIEAEIEKTMQRAKILERQKILLEVQEEAKSALAPSLSLSHDPKILAIVEESKLKIAADKQKQKEAADLVSSLEAEVKQKAEEADR
eukprot:IDg12918t1